MEDTNKYIGVTKTAKKLHGLMRERTTEPWSINELHELLGDVAEITLRRAIASLRDSGLVVMEYEPAKWTYIAFDEPIAEGEAD